MRLARRRARPAAEPVCAANYIETLPRDLVKVAEACGGDHRGLIDVGTVEILDERTASTSLRDVYDYQPGWNLPRPEDRRAIIELVTAHHEQGGSPPASPSPMR